MTNMIISIRILMLLYVMLLIASVNAFMGSISRSNTRALSSLNMMAGEFATHFTTLSVPCGRGISLRDITKDVEAIVDSQGI